MQEWSCWRRKKREDLQRTHLGLRPLVVSSLLPDDDLPVVGAGSKDGSKLRVRPRHLPHGTFVARESGQRRGGGGMLLLRAYRKQLDGPIRRASRQTLPVVIHSHIVHHVLVPRFQGLCRCLRRSCSRRRHLSVCLSLFSLSVSNPSDVPYTLRSFYLSLSLSRKSDFIFSPIIGRGVQGNALASLVPVLTLCMCVFFPKWKVAKMIRMRLVNIAISEPQPHQHGHWTAVVAQEIISYLGV